MANRRFTQFNYSFHAMPVLVDCNVAIGGTGAVGTLKGPGVTSVTRLAAGTYRVKFQDNYYKYFNGMFALDAPVAGSDVAVTAIAPGTVYTITVVGTTTTAQWVTAGVPVGVTPAVGVAFLAAATSAGTGQAKVVGVSGISAIEIVGNPDLMLGPSSANQGAYLTVQCLGATDASTTTLIAKDPASGSVLRLAFWLSNSSVIVAGE